MAESALKKLEEQLNCSICLDTYTDPKELQCHHVFCHKCLLRMVVPDQQGLLTLTCPSCRQVTPVPASGVRDLQSAFHINHLLEIRDSVKKNENLGSCSLEGAAGGSSKVKRASYCAVHSKREVELYCETCGELICMKCAIAGGKHNSHTYMELAEAFEKYEEEMKLSLESMENKLVTIKTALEQLDACCGRVSDHREAVETNIHTTMERLHHLLDARKTELIDKLHCFTKAKLKNLAVQKDLLETIQAQLSSCLAYTRESFQTGDHEEVLKMKKNIVKQIKDFTTTIFLPAMITLNTEAYMFGVSDSFINACKSCGEVFMAHAIGEGLEAGKVGETSTMRLKVANTNHLHDIPIQCELVSTNSGTIIPGHVKGRGQNRYEISYQPTTKGMHQLHIKILREHIRGSPFSVAVAPSVNALPISTIGVAQPWGVTINQRRELVVARSGAHCVSVLSIKGERLLSFGCCGSNQGEFHNPRGVALDNDGNIVVVDSGNHRIQKFTATGHFLAAVHFSKKEFRYPQDVAFNTSNNKLYAVDFNHCVHILNSDLTPAHIFGKFGHGEAEFHYPWGIACDSAGRVYVADGRNHRIQVFTAEGIFLKMFGGIAKAEGGLKDLFGIAVSNTGMVYVSNGGSGISTFTSDGKFVTTFGRKGGTYRGLVVDSRETLYACHYTTGCIDLY